MKKLVSLLVLAALPSVACAVADGEPRSVVAAPDVPGASKAVVPATAEFDHGHRLLDELLRAHVRGDWLDYQGVAAEREKLDRYLKALHGVTPKALEGWSTDQRHAFWINVYNAHVIQLVLDNYPVRSIKDIGGVVFNKVWDLRFIPMTGHDPEGKGRKLSLDDVEHKILRPRFEDARVHAAVNCASFSCPPLLGEAFVAERIDEQLDAQMKRFVNDGLRNVFDEEKKVLRLSEIFNWFEADFVRDAGSVREYVLRYAPRDKQKLVREARIKHLDYDWSLNDVEENRI